MSIELPMTRRRAFGLAALPAAFALAGTAPVFGQTTGPKLSIRVVNTAGMSNLIFEDMLVSQGILDGFGVQMTSLNLPDGTKVAKALLDGKADICMQAGFAPVMPMIENGAPFKIVAGGDMSNPQAIYSAKPDIHVLKDLVGRTVGVGALGAAMHQKTVALLRKYDVDDKQVKFVNLGNTLSILKAIQAGTVDAGPADIDIYDKQAAYGIHALSDGSIWSELPEYTNQASYATTTVLAQKRDAVVRIVASYAKLYRFLESPQSRDAWLTTWAKVAKAPVPKKPDALWELYQKERPFPPKIALSSERIRYVQELNVSMGLQKHVLSYAQVSDPTIARDALKLLG